MSPLSVVCATSREQRRERRRQHLENLWVVAALRWASTLLSSLLLAFPLLSSSLLSSLLLSSPPLERWKETHSGKMSAQTVNCTAGEKTYTDHFCSF